jgi:RNA polymerase sigma-70 factor, ECF subfamily
MSNRSDPDTDHTAAPAKHGTEAAMRWLDKHGDYLFCYALSRVTDSHVAEDLVQETLLGAIQSHGQFGGRSSVRTWLTSIMRHKIADHLRRPRRLHEGQDDARASEEAMERFADSQFTGSGKWRTVPGRWAKGSDDPSAIAESEDFRKVLRACLEELPERSAEAIDLAERREMTLKQISNILGVTSTNIGVLLYRARLALRRCLEANWFRGR